MRNVLILLLVWSRLMLSGEINSVSSAIHPEEVSGLDHIEGNSVTGISRIDRSRTSPVESVIGALRADDSNADNMKLFPNPNNGHFSIEFANPVKNDKCEIVISDLIGKQIYHDQLSGEESSKDFDLHDLKSGIYIMVIRDKEILVTRKFIKK